MRAVKTVQRSTAGRVLGYSKPILALAVLWGTQANAEVIETVSIQNIFGYVVGSPSTPATQTGGSHEEHYQGQSLPGAQSEVGLNYTATADSGGFFFLHDNYCVGTCATYSQTVITFTLFNNSDSSVDLRFDSQITPGHLARIAGNAAMNGQFNFDVSQGFGEGAVNLYSASGGINSDGIFLNTGGLAFNGLNQTDDPNGRWRVVDWSTTNLSVPLATIGAGQTTQVSYIATYYVTAGAGCADVTDCQGLQVVFGDPRNNGGVTLARDLADAALDDPTPVYPVIGRDYDPTFVRALFVTTDTPLPPNPDARPPVNYGLLFDPRTFGVPEPATWAMMIGGFGMIGGAMRRRRKVHLAVC